MASDRERRRANVFAERYLVHGNGTDAALEAAQAVGIQGLSRPAAATWASRRLAMPEVQARIAELRDAVQARVRTERAVHTESTVADVTEVLTVLTEQMRGRKPWRVRRSKQSYPVMAYDAATKRNVRTMVEATTETQVAEPGLAASRILDHYDGVGTPTDDGRVVDMRTQMLVILRNPEDRRAFDQIAAKLVPVAPTGGNGHHPSNGNGNGTGR